MPRPIRAPAALSCLCVVICCAALGPSALHAALAAAAGSLFEAAPFVLVSEAMPSGQRFRLLAAFMGCGCSRAMPGALSFAALGLCWLTFGPAVTLARAAVAALLLLRGSRRGTQRGEPREALAELLALVPAAAAASALAGFITGHASAAFATPAGGLAAFCLGLVLGTIAPCGTAAVAIAAAFAPHLGNVAAGILTTGGLAPSILRLGNAHDARETPEHGNGRPNVTRVALGIALATLALSGPRGFINPRLVPLEGVGAALALLGYGRRSLASGVVLVPAVLFVALLAGSPEPSYLASETHLDDAFAGEPLSFIGVAHRAGRTTILQRFAITCCRIDASAVAVRTALPLGVADGAWVAATGVLVYAPGGLMLRTKQWRRIARPADPFVYR